MFFSLRRAYQFNAECQRQVLTSCGCATVEVYEDIAREVDSLEKLGQRIGNIAHFDADEICSALKQFADRGSLQKIRENCRLCWQWAD